MVKGFNRKELKAFTRPRWRQIAILFTLGAPVLLFASRFYDQINELTPVDISLRQEFHGTDSNVNNEVSESVDNKAIPSIDVSVKDVEPMWQSKGRSLSRTFSPWSGSDPYGWCVKDANDASGLLFIKIQKCASSTGSGISLTIAHNVARRKHHHCLSHVRHYRTQELPIPSRNKEKSLLWTIVRHPAKRAVSSYFFYEISQGGGKPIGKAMRKYLKGEKNFEIESLQQSSLSNYTIKDIIQEMDFIAVSERMDESLVVFRLLNGFKPKDMIVLSSKKHGGYDGGRNGACNKIVSSFTPPVVEEYLSTSFEEDNDDFVLYAAANASLDKTIDMLGRDLVEKEVRRHRYLQTVANKYCQESAKFPCSDEGVHQLKLSRESCFERDWGCGYKCVHKVLKGL